MSRMIEVLTKANDIARQRGSDVVPPQNLRLRCTEALFTRAEFTAAIDEAIETGQLRKTEDGQLLLIRE